MQRTASTRRAQTGFTLVELVVTLAIASIVTVWGIPSLVSLMRINHVANAANHLVAHLQLARLEAVNRNLRVVVCPSTVAAGEAAPDARPTCDKDADEWAEGYMVAVRNPDDSYQPVRMAEEGAYRGLTIDSGGRTRIQFQPDGSAGGSNSTIVVRYADDDDLTRVRAVVVNAVGRAYVRFGTADDLQ